MWPDQGCPSARPPAPHEAHQPPGASGLPASGADPQASFHQLMRRPGSQAPGCSPGCPATASHLQSVHGGLHPPNDPPPDEPKGGPRRAPEWVHPNARLQPPRARRRGPGAGAAEAAHCDSPGRTRCTAQPSWPQPVPIPTAMAGPELPPAEAPVPGPQPVRPDPADGEVHAGRSHQTDLLRPRAPLHDVVPMPRERREPRHPRRQTSWVDVGAPKGRRCLPAPRRSHRHAGDRSQPASPQVPGRMSSPRCGSEAGQQPSLYVGAQAREQQSRPGPAPTARAHGHPPPMGRGEQSERAVPAVQALSHPLSNP